MIRCFVNPGDEVLIVEPSFVCYKPLTELAGGVPVIIEIGIPAVRVYMAGKAIMGAQSACQNTFLALSLIHIFFSHAAGIYPA